MIIKRLLPNKIKTLLFNSKPVIYYKKGKSFLNDAHYLEVQTKNTQEYLKKPTRTTSINFLLSIKQGDTTYLEIGVRNPDDNFKHITATSKYSVDPGFEFAENPVDFKMTSDVFFQKLSNNEVLSNTTKFDVIFIDGLHLAEQVDKDVTNALHYIKEDGFVVLHDCNPPTEWHSREHYRYFNTPAHGAWNGTTWKAFLKWRSNAVINSCCIDSDWGVGILSKTQPIGKSIKPTNPFYEFNVLDSNRKTYLNLLDFNTLKSIFQK